MTTNPEENKAGITLHHNPDQQLRESFTIHLREMGWVKPELAEHYAQQLFLVAEPFIESRETAAYNTALEDFAREVKNSQWDEAAGAERRGKSMVVSVEDVDATLQRLKRGMTKEQWKHKLDILCDGKYPCYIPEYLIARKEYHTYLVSIGEMNPKDVGSEE